VELTKANIYALLGLGRIAEGKQSFLNVLDADDLVRLGLANRYGSGQYTLTELGEDTLKKVIADNKVS
jgi:hypothetical protein